MSQERGARALDWMLPLGLFGLALLLRFTALGWGLPYVEHPDEPALVEVAMRMVQRGDPSPHRFIYPSLHFYLLTIAAQLHAWWGVRQGFYGSLHDLPQQTYFFTTAPGFYLWGRAISALLGAVTVPLLYKLGRQLFDWRVGLLAGLALALAPFHVEHSHFITTDVSTGLWLTVALIGAWGIATTGGWRAYLLAGLAVGMAAGTKYNAGTVACAVVLAHVLHWRLGGFGRRLWLPIMAGVAALLTFVITSPFVVIEWRQFLSDLRFNSQHYRSGGHGDFIGTWRIDQYAAFLWNKGLLPGGAILALASLPVLARRRPRQLALLIVGAIIPGLLPLLLLSVNFVRNVLPILPLLLLLAAAGAVALADLVRQRGRWAALALLAAVLVAPLASETGWLLRYWSRPYTMAAAADALRELPRGMLAAVEQNPVQWAGDPRVFPLQRVTVNDVAWYRARGFRYLILNSDRRAGDQLAAAELVAASAVIQSYPERDEGIRPGPGGALLDLGEHEQALPFVRRPIRFGEAITLLGYELRPGELRSQITPLEGADERVIQPGQPLQINLYWRSHTAMEHDYTLFIHVYNEAGERVAQRDLPLRYRDYPTSHWRPGELVIDSADLPLPALPPGSYRLALGLYDAASGAGLAPQESGQDGLPPLLTTLEVR